MSATTVEVMTSAFSPLRTKALSEKFALPVHVTLPSNTANLLCIRAELVVPLVLRSVTSGIPALLSAP